MGVHTIAAHAATREAREILDSIRRLVQELRLADREAENKLGLSGAQLFVLQKVGEQPTMSVNDLAERTCTHQSSVSVVVQKLVEKRLINRQESADDRRRVELSLTAEGQTLLSHFRHTPQDRLIQAIDFMPAKDRKQLTVLLAGVVETMGLATETPEMFFETERRATARNPKAAKDGK